MAMQVEGWAYAMSQKGRTFNLHGHVFQWTGVRIQKIKVIRKVLEFSVSAVQGKEPCMVSPARLNKEGTSRQKLNPISTLPVRPLSEEMQAKFVGQSPIS